MAKIRRFVWVLVAACALPMWAGSSSAACTGDCDGDGTVAINELVAAVGVALGRSTIDACAAADLDGDGSVAINELIAAVRNALQGCPAEVTPTPTQTPAPGGGLGRRRFSIDPEASRVVVDGIMLGPSTIPLVSTSVNGFFELEAGPEDPETGLRRVHLTDASDFISIVIQIPVVNQQIVLCARPQVDQFPLENVGGLACNGFPLAGVHILQDHNISDEDPTCSTGLPDINPTHPGVCNGPIEAELIEGDSGPGALAFATDPEALEGGLPVEITLEDALPCGDEGPGEPGFVFPLALSTGIARATILDRNNQPGQTLEVEVTGENFDCSAWTQEDGPGKLVFAGPVVDFDTMLIGFFDIAITIELED